MLVQHILDAARRRLAVLSPDALICDAAEIPAQSLRRSSWCATAKALRSE